LVAASEDNEVQSDECRVQNEDQIAFRIHPLSAFVFILHSALITLHYLGATMSYAQQSDIENVFGPSNVAAWTLYESGTPDGSADPTRIASALAYADGEINGFFADGPYALPMNCTINQPTLAYWAGVIAGVWLYGSRVSTSYIDYAGNRYLALRSAVYADMQLYKSGVKRLDAALRYPHATAPTAV
jgi:hypothetical protein